MMLHRLHVFEKVRLKEKILDKRKILMWLGYGSLVAFVIWFVIGLGMDYYSHIGTDIPISP